MAIIIYITVELVLSARITEDYRGASAVQYSSKNVDLHQTNIQLNI